MGNVLLAALIGLVVGALARLVMPGDQKMGWILTCILGVAGSLGATYVGHALGMYAPDEKAGWIASVVGALILLFVVGKLRSKTPPQ